MQVPDISDLESWLSASEAKVPNLRPDCAKSIAWAGKVGVRSKIALVYIHGFSATKHELQPLPDLIAKGLGANLHATRLTGHGQDGAAMGETTLTAWRADVAQALAIGHALGEQVLIMGCSTGCTLATDALANGAKAAGLVHISPNFGLAHSLAQLMLDLPFARHWGHLIAGKTRRFEPISVEHAAYWTTSYPTRSVYTMADAVRAVMAADLSLVTTPALFAYNQTDQVVSAKRTQKIIGRWGGPAATHLLTQGPDDDAMGHVMAGDVFSPAQTAPLANAILRWFTAERHP